MTKTDKIADAVIWLFNLLTFLVAVLGLFGLCYSFYGDWEMFKGFGDVLFSTALFVVSGGIAWKTGRWLFSKPDQIYVPGLLAFWVFLIFIYLMLLAIGIGRAGAGLSG
ncbi:MAG: hypothetical protein ACKVUS_21315 [Saprospiraceae bacterium]